MYSKIFAMSKNKILGLGRPELTLAETLLDLNASAVRAEVVEARRSVKGLRGVSRQEDDTSLA